MIDALDGLLERIAALEGERDGLLREVTDYRRLLASFGGRTHNNTMSFDFRTNDRGELEMTGPHYGVDWRGWPSASDRAALDAARVGCKHERLQSLDCHPPHVSCMDCGETVDTARVGGE